MRVAMLGLGVNPELGLEVQGPVTGEKVACDGYSFGLGGGSLNLAVGFQRQLPPDNPDELWLWAVGATGEDSDWDRSMNRIVTRKLTAEGIRHRILRVRQQSSLAVVLGPSQPDRRVMGVRPDIESWPTEPIERWIRHFQPHVRIATSLYPNDVEAVRHFFRLPGKSRNVLCGLNGKIARFLGERSPVACEFLGTLRCLILNHEEFRLLAHPPWDPSDPKAYPTQLPLLAEFLGLQTVVVTCAEHGAILFERGHAHPIDRGIIELDGPVVDATGGGDAFVAGFLPAWIHSLSPRLAMVRGLVTAAHNIRSHGGSSMPTFAQVERDVERQLEQVA